jgi:hypothetical protein
MYMYTEFSISLFCTVLSYMYMYMYMCTSAFVHANVDGYTYYTLYYVYCSFLSNIHSVEFIDTHITRVPPQ